MGGGPVIDKSSNVLLSPDNIEKDQTSYRDLPVLKLCLIIAFTFIALLSFGGSKGGFYGMSLANIENNVHKQDQNRHLQTEDIVVEKHEESASDMVDIVTTQIQEDLPPMTESIDELNEVESSHDKQPLNSSNSSSDMFYWVSFSFSKLDKLVEKSKKEFDKISTHPQISEYSTLAAEYTERLKNLSQKQWKEIFPGDIVGKEAEEDREEEEASWMKTMANKSRNKMNELSALLPETTNMTQTISRHMNWSKLENIYVQNVVNATAKWLPVNVSLPMPSLSAALLGITGLVVGVPYVPGIADNIAVGALGGYLPYLTSFFTNSTSP